MWGEMETTLCPDAVWAEDSMSDGGTEREEIVDWRKVWKGGRVKETVIGERMKVRPRESETVSE